MVHAICRWLKCRYVAHDYSVLGTKRPNNLDAKISEHLGSTCNHGPFLTCHLQWRQITTFSLPSAFRLLTASLLPWLQPRQRSSYGGMIRVWPAPTAQPCSHSSALGYGGATHSSCCSLSIAAMFGNLVKKRIGYRIPTRPTIKKLLPSGMHAPGAQSLETRVRSYLDK